MNTHIHHLAKLMKNIKHVTFLAFQKFYHVLKTAKTRLGRRCWSRLLIVYITGNWACMIVVQSVTFTATTEVLKKQAHGL